MTNLKTLQSDAARTWSQCLLDLRCVNGSQLSPQFLLSCDRGILEKPLSPTAPLAMIEQILLRKTILQRRGTGKKKVKKTPTFSQFLFDGKRLSYLVNKFSPNSNWRTKFGCRKSLARNVTSMSKRNVIGQSRATQG
ncbi:hypothetical protein CDAR_260271 [Caerostris darwini]|uniref:Uncharacterized protein n=1 Tax=Caerostris darwini TaxID=1538125 RepID=A0AAV4VGK6_9ARAC|nr:hypothetical protein CDAR_260271 [Caerostris darwini]